jgi:hypothetical protein
VLVGGGADEAPEVYKRLPEVLGAHAGEIRVKHTLRPLGVAMAGRDVYDPYKDWPAGSYVYAASRTASSDSRAAPSAPPTVASEATNHASRR